MSESDDLGSLPEPEKHLLLHEHGELVQLFIHEDAMVWRFNFGLIAGNAAIIAGAYNLDLFDGHAPSYSLIAAGFVLAFGVLLNLAGYFVLERSKVHRLSRLFRAYAIEDRFTAHASSFKTFRSAEGNLFRGRVLEPDGTSTRPLCSYERVSWLNFRVLHVILAFVMTFFLIWLCFGRPYL